MPSSRANLRQVSRASEYSFSVSPPFFADDSKMRCLKMESSRAALALLNLIRSSGVLYYEHRSVGYLRRPPLISYCRITIAVLLQFLEFGNVTPNCLAPAAVIAVSQS